MKSLSVVECLGEWKYVNTYADNWFTSTVLHAHTYQNVSYVQALEDKVAKVSKVAFMEIH